MSIESEDSQAAARWRLVLGEQAEEALAPTGEEKLLSDKLGQMDERLAALYDREVQERGYRMASLRGGSELSVPAWLASVRELFPASAVGVMERDALHRYGLTELLTDPEVMRTAERTPELVTAILAFRSRLAPAVKQQARRAIHEVVSALRDDLMKKTASSLRGRPDARTRPKKTLANADWNRTIRKNLRRYDPASKQLAVERIEFRRRANDRSPWSIVLLVDQSGSMLESLLHASVVASVFAALPHVALTVLAFDHRVVDLSEHASDPLELLTSAQLGGGTRLAPAMREGALRVVRPQQTAFVVVSDFFVYREEAAVLSVARELTEAGVVGFALGALDLHGAAVCNERLMREFSALGWETGTPLPADLVASIARAMG